MVVRSLRWKTWCKKTSVPEDFNGENHFSINAAPSCHKHHTKDGHLQTAPKVYSEKKTLKNAGKILLSLLGHRNFSGTGWGSRTCGLGDLWCIHCCYKSEMFMPSNPEEKNNKSQVGGMFLWYGAVEFWKTFPSKIVTKSWAYRIAHEKGGFLYEGVTFLPVPNFRTFVQHLWNRNSRKMKPCETNNKDAETWRSVRWHVFPRRP